MVLDLRAPEGPIRLKYSRFVGDGEPPNTPGMPFYGQHAVLYMRGDARTAKSTALVDKLIMRALFYPGSQSALLRASLQDIKRSTLQTLLSRARQAGVNLSSQIFELNRNDWEIKWPNGSKTWLFGLEFGDAVGKLQSTEFFFVAIDEVNQLSEEIVDLALIRAMSQKVNHGFLTGPDGEPLPGFNQLAMVSNRNDGVSWLVQRFKHGSLQIIPDHYRKTYTWTGPGGAEYRSASLMIEAFFHENESSNVALRNTMGMLSGDARNTWFGGVDLPSAGLVFPEFSHEHHVVTPFPIPEEGDIYVGIDHGTTNPTAGVFIWRSYEGDYFVFDEYVASKVTASDNARMIASKIANRKNRIQFYCDPSMFNTLPDGRSIADYYAMEGVPLFASERMKPGGRGDPAIVRLHEWLAVRGRRGGVVKPKIFWFSSAPASIRQMSSIVYSQLGTHGRDDHLFDALRYAIVGIPEISPSASAAAARAKRVGWVYN